MNLSRLLILSLLLSFPGGILLPMGTVAAPAPNTGAPATSKTDKPTPEPKAEKDKPTVSEETAAPAESKSPLQPKQSETPSAVDGTGDSSPDALFKQAKEAFKAGKFDEAEELCRTLLKGKHYSVALFQLLGHISYRQDDLGQASLWYQRAKLFPPPQLEVRQNISHIRDRTGNINFSSSGVHHQYASLLSRSSWFSLFSISIWSFIVAWALGAWVSSRSGLYTLSVFVRVVAGIVALFTIAGWYWHPSYKDVKDIVVVTTPDTRAYTAATATSGSVMNIPPGSGLKKLEQRGAWTYVEIPTNNEPHRGWVPSDAITALWPFDPGYLQ